MAAFTPLFSSDTHAGICRRAEVQRARNNGRMPAPQSDTHAGFTTDRRIL